MQPVRVGILGCGFVGRLHAQRLAADARVVLSVFCDPDRQGATRLRDEFASQAAVETDASAALESHPLDGVVICSPTPLHHAQVCRAFDRGLHVLCEKPLASTRTQIEDLLARARLSDRVFSVSLQRRYLAPYQTARRELQERAEQYGALRQVHVFVCERWHQTIHGTWRDDPQVGAGYFGDAGSHQIDAVFYITGRQAERVLAVSDRRGSRVEIATRVLARLTGGVDLSADFVGDAHHMREDIHFHCEHGDLLLRNQQVFYARQNQCDAITDLLPGTTPDHAFIDAIVAYQPGNCPLTLSPASCALPLFDWTAAVLRSVGGRLSAEDVAHWTTVTGEKN